MSDPDMPQLLQEIHHRVEAAEKKRITQEEMAIRLGISKRTYVEYLRGTNRPKGLSVMFQLLQMLDRDDLNRVIGGPRSFRPGTETENVEPSKAPHELTQIPPPRSSES